MVASAPCLPLPPLAPFGLVHRVVVCARGGACTLLIHRNRRGLAPARGADRQPVRSAWVGGWRRPPASPLSMGWRLPFSPLSRAHGAESRLLGQARRRLN